MRELTSIAGTQGAAVSSRLKIMGGLDIAERRAPQDGRVSIKRDGESIDVRIAILPTTHGEKVTLRILSQGEAPDSLDALGMWPRSRAALERAISQPFGAVVVVGPTGSGKTTTLYTCLQVLNTPDRQLTTIEDPVEYRAAGLDQIEVNPRAGLSFANGLQNRPALGSRRAARRRGSRRGNRSDRLPGGDDGAPRAHDPARSNRRLRNPAPHAT